MTTLTDDRLDEETTKEPMVSNASRALCSVGIDVGTTTTQVVFSDLVVRSRARLGAVPRLEVTARAVRYQGPTYLTPLTSPDEVDVEALVAIVRDEYRAAGVDAREVDTGAVIITGETARARNADAILEALADLAGDFVVTVAGPNVEAQIAARGSGAAAWSAERYTQVVNVDIGGGSSNAAVFESGRHLGSAASAVGGRQLQLDPVSGVVTAIAPPGRALVEALGLPLAVGRRAELPALERFCDAMADVIVGLALGRETELGRLVALTPPLPLTPTPSAVFLSGGVGSCYYDQLPAGSLSEVARFGDVGPLLARALQRHPQLGALPVLEPEETIRATVLGAASQTVTLSGSTIWASEELLPLRNLPVVEPHLDDVPTSAELAAAIAAAARRWDAERDVVLALALPLPNRLDYPGLRSIAEGIVAYSETATARPVVLVIEHDYAQSLGQTIQSLHPDLPLIAIDQIGLGEGDFIDIGQPILDGRVVPVSVKTLVFYR